MVGFFASHLVAIQKDQVQVSVTPGGDVAVNFGSEILSFDRGGIKNEQALVPLQLLDALFGFARDPFPYFHVLDLHACVPRCGFVGGARPIATHGQIVVARIEEEVTVKRFQRTKRRNQVMLLPENDAYQPIEVDLATQNFAIEGLSVGVIRQHL